MRSRLPLLLIAVLTLAAVVGCARQQPASSAGPAVSPPPKMGTTPTTPPAGKAATTTATTGQDLFQTKCTKCHTTDRVKKHDPAKEPWSALVPTMQAKKKGWITDQDKATIVAYLDQAYPAK